MADSTFNSKRLGIHYFADTAHFHKADLELWLPKLSKLGISWLVVQTPLDRAIPEEFITSLIRANIQPIVHFQLPLDRKIAVSELATLFKSYANWGVRHVVLFDRPNLRAQWPATGWTQRGLVDRFIDLFAPLARAAQKAGLIPVFPALEPGGDYWDTAFLRASLEKLAERGEQQLLQTLTLGAYIWTDDKGLDWGMGGPEAWPASLPYHTPTGSEDQRGFRIFDWYNAMSKAALGKELPILILAAGVNRGSTIPRDAQPSVRYIKMAQFVQKQPSSSVINGTVPANVLACNFWLLAAESGMAKNDPSAWFLPSGNPTKLGESWLKWRNGRSEKSVEAEGLDNETNTDEPLEQIVNSHESPVSNLSNGSHAIRHYLLLPSAADWPLASIQSYVTQYQPTIGYSAEEAQRAARVTLAGGLQSFSDELIRSLIAAGCQVENLPAAS